MKLNCIVVDDSAIQRAVICKLVESHPNLVLINEFSNAIETRNFLNDTIDLLLLDIEMPLINGFELLDNLSIKPQVIFVTVKADYALRAFEYDATDYLHKPINKERFNIAIKRAVANQEMKLNATKNTIDNEHIFIKSNFKNVKLYTSKINWLEAYGDYVKIILEGTNDVHTVLSTLKQFESQLPSDKFIRVHKSYIVNISKVKHYDSKTIEIGNTKIPLSRERKVAISKALEYQ